MKSLVAQRRRRPPNSRLDLSSFRITLPASGKTEPRMVRPGVRHSVDMRWPGPADSSLLPEVGGIPHRFDAVVERSEFDILRNDQRVGEKIQREASDREWNQIARDYLVEGESVVHPDHFIGARLEVDEYPVHIVEYGPGWYRCTDGGGTEAICSLVDSVKTKGYDGGEMDLREGSLLWLKTIGVHPRLRGQNLGLALIAHALWELYRCRSDVAVLEVNTIDTLFDKHRADAEPGTLTKLSKYYAQLGFTAVDRAEAKKEEGGLLMMLPLGARGIRALGVDGVAAQGFETRPRDDTAVDEPDKHNDV